MTTEEKINKLNEFCEDNGHQCGRGCPLDCYESCNFGEFDEDDVSKAYDLVFPTTDEPHIKDSGERREFTTGAVRDIQEGKGRCDLMPLDVIGGCYGRLFPDETASYTFEQLHGFTQSGDIEFLYNILNVPQPFDRLSTMFLEVAKHFEEGAKKYGEHNWQKGIPTHCYIDSAIRHYLKWGRGDKDEPHDRAFVWNILCCIWTCRHKPELNDYLVQDDEEREE